MGENMVRTQVYLPRAVHEKLKRRAEQQGLTLAVQIRSALEDYLDRVEAEEDDGILRADDPIFQMIGMYSSGVSDTSVNHDHYLYGWPKREPSEETPVVQGMREKPATYRTKRRKSNRKRKTR